MGLFSTLRRSRDPAQCSADPPPLPTIGDTSLPDELSLKERERKLRASEIKKDAPPPPPTAEGLRSSTSNAQQYANPGTYENFSSELRRVLSPDVHDGCRFDITKPLTPLFTAVHSFWLGTSMLPDGSNSNYAYVAQLHDEAGLLMCRLDPVNRSVDGRIIRVHNFSEGEGSALTGTAKAQLNVSPSGQSDQLVADYELNGPTYTLAGKYGSMGGGNVAGVSYLQAVTPSLVLGGEAMYIAANGSLLGSYSARYAGTIKSDSLPATGIPPSQYTVYGQFHPAQGMLTAAYRRAVTPGRVVIGTELSINPGTLEATVTTGMEVTLRQGRVNCAADGTGKFQTVVETTVMPGTKLSLCGEADHGKGAFRFGYGFSVGS
uniref:Uncharacterized protein n=1 Tax=Corethron hystrix TaxID=216773 RepID=A0A6U5EBE6_9STRA|mmetsp:Transcript_16465/g.36975  ORF Transcript_16465/g.36975 Transcript_16465/m.36975 type:complete len:376 (+) Transcript_16465:103-1230(+)